MAAPARAPERHDEPMSAAVDGDAEVSAEVPGEVPNLDAPPAQPAAEPPPEPIFVGREAQIAEAVAALVAGGSVVVRGKAGVGKRALMRQVRKRLAASGERLCLWPSITTPKAMAADLAEQVHNAVGLQVPERLVPPRFRAAAARTGVIEFRHIKRTLTREPVAEQLQLVMAALAGRSDVILFVESLEIPPTQADMLHQLAEHVQIAATIEDTNHRNRVMRLLWRFERTIELKPLARAEVREWVQAWLAAHPLHFESPKLEAAFVSAVCRDSGGVPAAVEGMLAIAAAEPEVSRKTVRDLTHEAAVQYLDMTPLLILVAAGFMALRYVSRGMGMQELMVMAGVGTSLFWVVLYFARMMQAKR